MAQLDLGIDMPNHIPVVYRNELEISQFSSVLPTIIMIGFTIYLFRRMGSAMGGKKGGGLFGNVMSSTAKLINPNEIDVRFK